MITGTFNTAYGVVTVEIDAGVDPVVGQITAIGSIKYEFDLTPESVVVQRLMCVYQRLDCTWLLNGQEGDDMYDILSPISFGTVPVMVTIAGYDGNTYTFPFSLSGRDVSLDERTQTIKTSLGVFANESVTIQDVWDNMSTNYSALVFPYRVSGVDYDATNAQTWLEVAMWMVLFGGTGTITQPIQFHSILIGPYFTSPSNYLANTYAGFNVTDPVYYNKTALLCIDVAGFLRGGKVVADLSAVDTIQSMAGFEGGTFGTGFNTIFYMNRTVNFSQLVTINYETEVLELAFKINYTAFRNITSGTVKAVFDAPDNAIPNMPNRDVTSTMLNRNAEKSILLRLEAGYPVMQVGIIGAGTNRVDTISTGSAQTAMDGYLAGAIQAYKVSFPAIGNLTIAVSIYGFGRVKPWEVFQFDSTAPARYQGKKFRINSAEYNLISNTTKIRAYEVT